MGSWKQGFIAGLLADADSNQGVRCQGLVQGVLAWRTGKGAGEAACTRGRSQAGSVAGGNLVPGGL